MLIDSIIQRKNINCDFAESWAIGFQDPASPWMYAIIDYMIVFYFI